MASTLQRLAQAAGLLCLALACQGAAAQAPAPRGYPEKPVRLLVGYSPGGLPDTVARIVAQRLTERWGQQVLVDNRPSANGILAAELVAKAAPDGYTLLVTDSSTTAINPYLYSRLPYDAKDFAPVSLIVRAPLFLAAHSAVPVSSLQELIALAKSRPGQLNYGSSGIGSTHHLCMEFLKTSLGLDLVHVPFKGTGQSVPALVAGQVNVVLSAYPSLSSYAKSGQIKLLAVNSPTRSALAPELPTIAEVAVPGFDFAPSIGVLAPAATPKEVIAKFSAEVARIVQVPEVAKAMANLGIEPVGGSAEEYGRQLGADAERYARAVKASGAKVD